MTRYGRIYQDESYQKTLRRWARICAIGVIFGVAFVVGLGFAVADMCSHIQVRVWTHQ